MPTVEILHSHTIGVLKKEISKTNIKGYSKMKKGEIVALMMEHKDRFHHIQMAGAKVRGFKAVPKAEPKAQAEQSKAEPKAKKNIKFKVMDLKPTKKKIGSITETALEEQRKLGGNIKKIRENFNVIKG
tara:strand:+ start:951 stop:1337 length:387 start_codon:yes stop_codon:yes gene_type:complete